MPSGYLSSVCLISFFFLFCLPCLLLDYFSVFVFSYVYFVLLFLLTVPLSFIFLSGNPPSIITAHSQMNVKSLPFSPTSGWSGVWPTYSDRCPASYNVQGPWETGTDVFLGERGQAGGKCACANLGSGRAQAYPAQGALAAVGAPGQGPAACPQVRTWHPAPGFSRW